MLGEIKDMMMYCITLLSIVSYVDELINNPVKVQCGLKQDPSIEFIIIKKDFASDCRYISYNEFFSVYIVSYMKLHF